MHRTAPTTKVLGSTCQSWRISIRFTKPQLRQCGITPKQKNKPLKQDRESPETMWLYRSIEL